MDLPFSNIFCGLFPGWIGEMNALESSAVSCCVKSWATQSMGEIFPEVSVWEHKSKCVSEASSEGTTTTTAAAATSTSTGPKMIDVPEEGMNQAN